MNQTARTDTDRELVELLVEDAAVQLEIWDSATKELIVSGNLAAVEKMLRVTHTLKGCAFSIGLLDFGNFLHALEDILGLVKGGEVRITALGQKFLVKAQRSMASWVEAIDKGKSAEPELKLQDLQRVIALKDFDLNIKSSIGAILIDTGMVTEEQIKAAVKIQNSRLGELLVSQKVISEAQLQTALERQKEIVAALPKRQEVEFVEKVFIPSPELDKLYSLCKEALLTSSGKARKQIQAIKEIVEEYTATSIGKLEVECKHIADYLQEKLQKKLTLEFQAAGGKIPKRTFHLLQIITPHLIRNAADHGLESPEERVAAKKSAVGHIRVKIACEERQLSLWVEDDGRGIDHKKIAAKLGKAVSSDASDNIEAIFTSGFSSRDSVSEVSGRGVGLDAVRANVKAAGGDIKVASKVGEGTAFFVKLPL